MSATVLKPIYDITSFSMLDYPEHIACVVWFAGCNFRCAYCHNPEIVKNKGSHTVDDLLEFLQKRMGKLEAVVFSGGECTLYPGLVDLARQVKELGFKIKVDSNGTRPQVLRQLVEENLVDYIAMDYKAPHHKMKDVIGVDKFKDFSESLAFLAVNAHKFNVEFEVRTTVHTDLLDENDVAEMRDHLAEVGYENTYYVQNFKECDTLGGLGAQKRNLDTEALVKAPHKVKVDIRNF